MVDSGLMIDTKPRSVAGEETGWRQSQRLFFLVLLFCVLGTSVYVAKVIMAGAHTTSIISEIQNVVNEIVWVHAVAALPPLLFGVVLFLPKFRAAQPRLHRWLGTIYCVGIWISSLTGILLAVGNWNGPIAQMGFGLLGTLWFLTTTQAYRTARAKNFVSHRRWMIRSYALTLAVVAVRPMFWFPPDFIEFEVWHRMVSWLCWVPNLIAGELYIRATLHNGNLRMSKRSQTAA